MEMLLQEAYANELHEFQSQLDEESEDELDEELPDPIIDWTCSKVASAYNDRVVNATSSSFFIWFLWLI